MREKAALYGKPRFGDKTPGHAVCLPEIFTDFPDARVVHVVRDPRETVQSLQRMPWTPPSLVFNALYLADERNQIAKWRNRILEVRLEDLLAQPRPTMKRRRRSSPFDSTFPVRSLRNSALPSIPTRESPGWNSSLRPTKAKPPRNPAPTSAAGSKRMTTPCWEYLTVMWSLIWQPSSNRSKKPFCSRTWAKAE